MLFLFKSGLAGVAFRSPDSGFKKNPFLFLATRNPTRFDMVLIQKFPKSEVFLAELQVDSWLEHIDGQVRPICALDPVVRAVLSALLGGRCSVIGAKPTMEIVAKENVVTIMDHRKGKRTKEIVEDLMVVPKRIMES
ncbi:hypothetical protein AgCh_021490 [Apium graveolens]